ncbi:MAG: hypothetical protein PHC69_02495 [Ruminiclostridium sp.]|nr:hypothetical protein [Ruminiclostridium sp.]
MKKWLFLALAAILMMLTFAGCANPAATPDTTAAAGTETTEKEARKRRKIAMKLSIRKF